MPLTDPFIFIRERFLDRLSGVTPDRVLNGDGTPPAAAPADLAAELKRAANALKAAGIDESGAHVDYSRLRRSAAYAHLRAQTPRLRHFDPGTLGARAERLAFWINLYNVLALDAVITFGVQNSVSEGRLGLLTFFRRAAYNIGGHRVALEDVEHGILRGNGGHPFLPGPHFRSTDARLLWQLTAPDPHIHFALNCASRSCPPIGVYDAAHIDRQLDLAARGFIAQSVEVRSAENQVRVSRIFKWYAGDFGGKAAVLAFVRDHLPGDDDRRRWLDQHADSARLVYASYDWSLNT